MKGLLYLGSVLLLIASIYLFRYHGMWGWITVIFATLSYMGGEITGEEDEYSNQT